VAEQERLVAVISPWEKLSEVVNEGFRVESLPREKKVAVWREDLQTGEKLAEELKKLGIAPVEIRTEKVTTKWQRAE